jgi:hypothetical protein
MDAGNSLLSAIKLSQQILQAIDEEQWDDITLLDQQRSPLIEQYFKSDSIIDKQQTQQLKQLNDEIVSRLIHIQQKNRNQQMSLTQAQKASKAYLDNA